MRASSLVLLLVLASGLPAAAQPADATRGQLLYATHCIECHTVQMLRSINLMLDQGPGDNPEGFFDVLRAMLFYIDEFPERLHHPSESNVLFFPNWSWSGPTCCR